MEETKTYRLGDICLTNQNQYSSQENWQVFEYLDTGSITRNSIDSIQIINNSKELPSRARRKVQDLDIIYSTVRPNQCHYGILRKPAQNLLVSTGFTVLTVDQSIANPYYIYYYLTQDSITNTLQAIAEQSVSAYPSLKSIDIENVVIELPSLDIQNKIASILTSLDSKISLNNRINHNLEEQAQSVFDRIVSRETDETITLSTIADINPARSIKKNDMARCIDMSCLSTVGSFPSGWEYRPYSGGIKFRNGDTLMARITPCLENGKVAYINFLEEEETAFGSTEYIVFHAKDGFPNEMFYFLTRNLQFVEYATKNMNGSSGRQRVSGETIGNYILPKIEKDELEELTIVTTAAMKQILTNSLEIRSLASMRDTLLPKLISGELNINDIDC